MLARPLLAIAIWSAALLCALAGQNACAKTLQVHFVNPGRTGELYWDSVVDFMRAAARDLDIVLTVHTAERDRLLMVDEGMKAVAARPDFLVIVNEQRTAAPVLEAANAAGVNTLLAFNDLVAADRDKIGPPRTQLKYYIGSLVPNNLDAGEAIARPLIAAANAAFGEGAPRSLFALNGLLATPAAEERFSGLQQVLAQNQNVQMVGQASLNWSAEEAEGAIAPMLVRYPDLRIIWAANDPMALGALAAARQAGRRPGQNIFIGGLNWSAPALAAIQAGEITVSVGGHFMAGGMSLVLLRDFADGFDFATFGVSQRMSFGAIDRNNVTALAPKLTDQTWSAVNFRRFSRALNPAWSGYVLDPVAVLGK